MHPDDGSRRDAVHQVDDPERPPWLAVDDLDVPRASGRPARSIWLFAAAVVPWVVVLGLLVRPSGAPEDPAAAATPTAGPSPEVGVAVAPSPTPDPLAPSATLLSSGALVAVDEDEARAVAIVAARRWLTTVGPGADPAGAGGDAEVAGSYAEHLVVEGIDHPAPGAAVVTVRAIVLRVAGDAYDGIDVRRVAVPLRFDAAGAAPAGEPWSLPLDDPPARVFEPTEAIHDPELLLLAGEALAAAGYRVVAVDELHRTAAWPLVATAEVAVGDAAPRTVRLWLRPHLGRLVVAGTRPRPPGDPSPSETPADPAAPAAPDPSASASDRSEEVAP